MTETGYAVRVLSAGEARPAGTMYVYMEQPLMPVPFVKKPIHEIALEAEWKDQVLVIDFESEVPAKVKILLVAADSVVIGKVSLLLVPHKEESPPSQSPAHSPASQRAEEQ
jgi:hypothetical protein